MKRLVFAVLLLLGVVTAFAQYQTVTTTASDPDGNACTLISPPFVQFYSTGATVEACTCQSSVWVCVDAIGGATPGFDALTTGTNTTATMTVGTGGSLTTSGSGAITATALPFSGLTASTLTGEALVLGAGSSLDTAVTGTIDATTGDSATSFFPTGTLEDARLPSTMDAKTLTGATVIQDDVTVGDGTDADWTMTVSTTDTTDPLFGWDDVYAFTAQIDETWLLQGSEDSGTVIRTSPNNTTDAQGLLFPSSTGNLASCNGGANDGKLCHVAGDCSGGSCDAVSTGIFLGSRVGSDAGWDADHQIVNITYNGVGSSKFVANHPLMNYNWEMGYQANGSGKTLFEHNWDFIPSDVVSATKWRPYAFALDAEGNSEDGQVEHQWFLQRAGGTEKHVWWDWTATPDHPKFSFGMVDTAVTSRVGTVDAWSTISSASATTWPGIRSYYRLSGSPTSGQEWSGIKVDAGYAVAASQNAGNMKLLELDGDITGTGAGRAASTYRGIDIDMNMTASGGDITGFAATGLYVDMSATGAGVTVNGVSTLIDLRTPSGSGWSNGVNGITIRDLNSAGTYGDAIDIKAQTTGDDPTLGNLYLEGGNWNNGHIKWGANDHLWFNDADNNWYVKADGNPSSATDGDKILTDAGITLDVHWDAADLFPDGTSFVRQTAAAINSVPVDAIVMEVEDSAAKLYGWHTMGDGWDGGALTFEFTVISTAAETTTFNGDLRVQCRGVDETISAVTWSSTVAVDIAITNANRVEQAETASVTPAGSCNGGDVIVWEYDLDEAATDAQTCAYGSADTTCPHITAVKMTYNSGLND